MGVLYSEIAAFNDSCRSSVGQRCNFQDFFVLGNKAVTPTGLHCILSLYCEPAKLHLLEGETKSFLNLS